MFVSFLPISTAPRPPPQHGRLPIHHSVVYRSTASLAALLEYGADPNATDGLLPARSTRPLDCAVQGGAANLAGILLAHGARGASRLRC